MRGRKPLPHIGRSDKSHALISRRNLPAWSIPFQDPEPAKVARQVGRSHTLEPAQPVLQPAVVALDVVDGSRLDHALADMSLMACCSTSRSPAAAASAGEPFGHSAESAASTGCSTAPGVRGVQRSDDLFGASTGSVAHGQHAVVLFGHAPDRGTATPAVGPVARLKPPAMLALARLQDAVLSASTMRLRWPDLAWLGKASKRWRWRKAVLLATSRYGDARVTLSPSISPWV
jgi:hypothetical protein